ncbi:MAG: symmetrical bis(5'-nucleosyl)-tetraphosphatase [Gammaproteobacteria bacterium]|nr:symmetrical bis(5'-nucleosyl)-tetraphosphatase [Gammaproteobacteria bacterium]
MSTTASGTPAHRPRRNTWAIGDVQGCLDALKALLEKIDFDPARDELWLTGDLVNRGPDSLETLRFVRDLGRSAVTVLGNHDLHLLAVAHGHVQAGDKDTFAELLAASDSDELLDWLRHRPLLHVDHELDCLMVHAGLPPQWNRAQALSCAHEVELMLQSVDIDRLLADMYGNQPDQWSAELEHGDDPLPRWRFTINACTRMRYCTADGQLDFREKGAPGSQREGLLPWYAVPDPEWLGQKIVFGHWSTLGPVGTGRDDVVALDTGCLWGGCLTAMRLSPLAADGEQPEISVDCRGALEPG